MNIINDFTLGLVIGVALGLVLVIASIVWIDARQQK